ncbi:MAG: acyltransferase [Clostridiales bacterium]|jgi:surface polysaccharide O-acyltransferase-like enzyme|nr:acyltransferase [Clostridiales bacterium]
MPRKSNIELARIVAFVFVVALHSVGWYLHVNTSVGDVNWIPTNAVTTVGISSVGIFMLISGYFYDSAKLRLRKLLGPIAFYLPFYYLYRVFAVYGGNNWLSPARDLLTFLPKNGDMLGHLWYVQCLVVVMVFAAPLRAAIDGLERRAHLLAAGAMLLFFSILPTVNYALDMGVFQYGLYSNELSTFVMMYFIGAYIRKYPVGLSARTLGIIAVSAAILAVAVTTAYCYRISPLIFIHPDRSYPFDKYANPFVDSRNLLTVVQSVTAFAFLTKLDIKSAFVNRIAALTYGGYVVHIFYVYLAMLLLSDWGINPPLFPLVLVKTAFGLTASLATEALRLSLARLIRRRVPESAS